MNDGAARAVDACVLAEMFMCMVAEWLLAVGALMPWWVALVGATLKGSEPPCPGGTCGDPGWLKGRGFVMSSTFMMWVNDWLISFDRLGVWIVL